MTIAKSTPSKPLILRGVVLSESQRLNKKITVTQKRTVNDPDTGDKVEQKREIKTYGQRISITSANVTSPNLLDFVNKSFLRIRKVKDFQPGDTVIIDGETWTVLPIQEEEEGGLILRCIIEKSDVKRSLTAGQLIYNGEPVIYNEKPVIYGGFR